MNTGDLIYVTRRVFQGYTELLMRKPTSTERIDILAMSIDFSVRQYHLTRQIKRVFFRDTVCVLYRKPFKSEIPRTYFTSSTDIYDWLPTLKIQNRDFNVKNIRPSIRSSLLALERDERVSRNAPEVAYLSVSDAIKTIAIGDTYLRSFVIPVIG